jgi:hypothetical protein
MIELDLIDVRRWYLAQPPGQVYEISVEKGRGYTCGLAVYGHQALGLEKFWVGYGGYGQLLSDTRYWHANTPEKAQEFIRTFDRDSRTEHTFTRELVLEILDELGITDESVRTADLAEGLVGSPAPGPEAPTLVGASA